MEIDLFTYIKNLFKENYSVELWRTWMGRDRKKEVEYEEINIENFSVEHLRELYTGEWYSDKCVKLIKIYT